LKRTKTEKYQTLSPQLFKYLTTNFLNVNELFLKVLS